VLNRLDLAPTVGAGTVVYDVPQHRRFVASRLLAAMSAIVQVRMFIFNAMVLRDMANECSLVDTMGNLMTEEYQVTTWYAGGIYFIPFDLKYFHENLYVSL